MFPPSSTSTSQDTSPEHGPSQASTPRKMDSAADDAMDITDAGPANGVEDHGLAEDEDEERLVSEHMMKLKDGRSQILTVRE